MVEFNLLPDVKMQYLRTKRLEHLVVTVSFIVGACSIAIFILLALFVFVDQKVTLNDLNNQISTSTSKLNSNTNLDKILTVQNQLQTLPTLENQTPTVSRLFGFLTQLTPPTATISSLDISFATNSVSISGAADSLATVNTYVDTLKYATFNNLTTKSKNNQAFSSVVLSSFNYSSTGGSSNTYPAEYSISYNFDPTLFASSDNIQLIVPSEVTTRSILNQPTLFQTTQSSKQS